MMFFKIPLIFYVIIGFLVVVSITPNPKNYRESSLIRKAAKEKFGHFTESISYHTSPQ